MSIRVLIAKSKGQEIGYKFDIENNSVIRVTDTGSKELYVPDAVDLNNYSHAVDFVKRDYRFIHGNVKRIVVEEFDASPTSSWHK
ncbi:MAG: hypothetical protein LAT68_14325 [Cyclobacteriaceae bacterium]|nr:hypothetical protein [Cyclobacteriaceae bacterium]